MSAERDADVEAVLAVARVIRPWTVCDDEGRFDHGSEQAARAVLVSDWLAARERAARVEAVADLTDTEVERIDFEMSEHMYRHSISNNVNGMSCNPDCRTRGLGRAVNIVLRDRAASYADQPAECEEDVYDYTMCACGKPMADHADQPVEGGEGA